jgi:hypothetical protein
MSHWSVFRSVAAITTLVLLGVALLASGCGSGQASGPDRPRPDDVRTIEEAQAAKSGTELYVRGALVATGAGSDLKIVLATVLLESYPPQAGGSTLPVEGLDLGSIAGLSSTVDRPEVSLVTWSDFWLVLGGVVSDGALKVNEVPQVIEADLGEAHARFSPVSEPLESGETVWWAFDLTNRGEIPLEVTFSSGQQVEVVLAQNGVEKYRWSAGKAFDQAIHTITLQPGAVLPVVVNDALQVAPGEYDFTATLTGAIASGATREPLPALTGKITVF